MTTHVEMKIRMLKNVDQIQCKETILESAVWLLGDKFTI
jgi:hypothetical protein